MTGLGLWIAESIPALCLLGLVYVLGTGHGLWLAWTQEAKCKRWAQRVECVYERVTDAYERGK